LSSLGDEHSQQNDVYFCAQSFIESSTTSQCPFVVRIRTKKSKTFLTYKSFTGDGSWIEHETEVSDSDATENILKSLGLGSYLRIEKDRISAKDSVFEINLDDIRDLGLFLEVETINEDVSTGKKKITEYVKKNLKLEHLEEIHEGYVQLAEKAGLGI